MAIQGGKDTEAGKERRSGMAEVEEQLRELIALQETQNALQANQAGQLTSISVDLLEHRRVVAEHMKRVEPALQLYEGTKRGLGAADTAVTWATKRGAAFGWVVGGFTAAGIALKHLFGGAWAWIIAHWPFTW